MRQMSRLARLALMTVVGLLLTTAPARAQSDESAPFQEPGISYRTFEKPYIQWVVGVAMMLACLGVAVKNPHRSHMD